MSGATPFIELVRRLRVRSSSGSNAFSSVDILTPYFPTGEKVSLFWACRGRMRLET